MTQNATAQPLSMDEMTLLGRLKAGDQDAYELLVRTLGGRLLVVARRILRDDSAADDAVQDAFLNAFRAMARFDGQAQLSTWLHRIVVNTCLMRLRSRQRKPEQSLEPLLPCFADDGHHAEPVVSWAESAERRLERDEVKALVWEGLSQLPDGYRALIVMRDIEGLSTHEAAAALGVSDNALKLRLHRARQAMAAILRQRMAPPPRCSRPVSRAAGAGARGGSTHRAALTASRRATRPVASATCAIPHASL
jgi:RNA polymerase sigma-70 factor (ECF subfamily)